MSKGGKTNTTMNKYLKELGRLASINTPVIQRTSNKGESIKRKHELIIFNWKAYKSPQNTPHKILIAFCEILDMHPYELIKDYQVGISRISDAERIYHQKGYHALNQA